MNIGLKIKALRKEQNITQEKLADYLNISYQAISKWENEIAMPDISLIVPIANFFGVSTDYLFDNDRVVNDDEIQKILLELSELRNVGNTTKAIKLLQDSLIKYPKEFKFMYLLASLLSGYHSTAEQEEIAKREKYVEQSIRWCEKILEDCSDEEIRVDATTLLCYQYPKVGERERAIDIAKKMPSIYKTGSLLLEHIYEGEESIKQKQENLKNYITLASMNLYYSAMQIKDLTLLEKIAYLKSSINIMSSLFYDGNYLFEHIRMFEIYLRLARYYADLNEIHDSVECLKQAKEHATKYEQLPDGDLYYTSRFINRLSFNKKTVITNSDKSLIENFKEVLSNKCFNNFRERDEFRKLIIF